MEFYRENQTLVGFKSPILEKRTELLNENHTHTHREREKRERRNIGGREGNKMVMKGEGGVGGEETGIREGCEGKLREEMVWRKEEKRGREWE